MRYGKIGLQVGALAAISLLGEGAVRLLNLQVPGNIMGLGMLFLLLQFELLPLRWIEDGASFLISELLLFFIPSAIGVMQFKALLMEDSLRLAAAIGLGTLVVLGVVGLFAEGVLRYGAARGNRA